MTTPQGTRARVPLLALREVSKYFGAVEALVGVDLEVYSHEVVALVGDNAAGKSTLAKIVAGVLTPDAGQVEIDGRAVNISSPSVAKQLGVASVFQDLAVAENLDVTANVYLGQELRNKAGLLHAGAMEVETRRLLEHLTVRIPSVRTPLRNLSAGQRQAVAIARTLIGDPRIVVLDEPTASLSVAQTGEVLTHIERLRELGLGVVLISHNLNDVRAVADRIEVLRHGRNNGSFPATESHETILAAITGAR
ncbi:ATP-binding cassette domain-containing protein [Isoptericola dokdonensis]|jgi:D-xylose transport system ATP-binding protein|uniref:Arabinose import ATP-binding protein AraG n=1 Tax=Isoptericola dokdonensis DS-3 TaxID=1300344 RepID=A0A161ICX1_9MICO|nr:ATP-binding cassette domain-containing protein [Isoptericola dokdonensis]ANC31037.1 Arabinose import ATP-binding protein AraG [Isoptericola dokdonensis DS-3]